MTVFRLTEDQIREMISTAFDDGTHFVWSADGDVTVDDVRVESDKYAEDFMNHMWWRKQWVKGQ